MVNDMVFEFRERFPEVMTSRYTIRDLRFISKTIKVDKARPRSHMTDIVAVVGTCTEQGKAA
jgi:pheromone shutdown protein TraB